MARTTTPTDPATPNGWTYGVRLNPVETITIQITTDPPGRINVQAEDPVNEAIRSVLERALEDIRGLLRDKRPGGANGGAFTCGNCRALVMPNLVDEDQPVPRSLPIGLCGTCRAKAGLPPR